MQVVQEHHAGIRTLKNHGAPNLESTYSVKGSTERKIENEKRSLWLCLEQELKKQTEINNLQKTNILLKNYKASSSFGALTVGNWSHG